MCVWGVGKNTYKNCLFAKYILDVNAAMLIVSVSENCS